jgi:hypothetical protein
MAKPSCKEKEKAAYHLREEAEALSLPGTDIYLCPRCGKFHSTSKQSSKKQNDRRRRYGR